MSDRLVLILHAEDDLSGLSEIRTHLAPLSRRAAIELVSASELAQAPDGSLSELLGASDALVVALSAPVLALPEMLEDRLRAAFEGPIEFLSLRPCAHRLVPWIEESGLLPEDGRLLDELDRRTRDEALCALVYRLANGIDQAEKILDGPTASATEAEAEEDAALEEVELDQDGEEAERAAEAPVEIAAGPGPDVETSPAEVQETLDPALAELGAQFDETCAAVLPADGPIDDEALTALIELVLVLGEARAELDDVEGEITIHRHAAGSLLRVLQGRETASEFTNDLLVVLGDALECDAGSAVAEAFKHLLEGAPQARR